MNFQELYDLKSLRFLYSRNSSTWLLNDPKTFRKYCNLEVIMARSFSWEHWKTLTRGMGLPSLKPSQDGQVSSSKHRNWGLWTPEFLPKKTLSPQEVFLFEFGCHPRERTVCESEVHDLLTETHPRSLTTSWAVGRRLPFLLDFSNFSGGYVC